MKLTWHLLLATSMFVSGVLRPAVMMFESLLITQSDSCSPLSSTTEPMKPFNPLKQKDVIRHRETLNHRIVPSTVIKREQWKVQQLCGDRLLYVHSFTERGYFPRLSTLLCFYSEPKPFSRIDEVSLPVVHSTVLPDDRFCRGWPHSGGGDHDWHGVHGWLVCSHVGQVRHHSCSHRAAERWESCDF